MRLRLAEVPAMFWVLFAGKAARKRLRQLLAARKTAAIERVEPVAILIPEPAWTPGQIEVLRLAFQDWPGRERGQRRPRKPVVEAPASGPPMTALPGTARHEVLEVVIREASATPQPTREARAQMAIRRARELGVLDLLARELWRVPPHEDGPAGGLRYECGCAAGAFEILADGIQAKCPASHEVLWVEGRGVMCLTCRSERP